MILNIYRLATDVSAGNLPHAAANTHQLQTILSIVFGIAGALALLMLVIGGLRYIISAGEPDKIAKAKSTIIYALVGLMIAVSAEAIVSFVVRSL